MMLRLSKKRLKNICMCCILFVYFLFGIMVSFNSLNLSERLNNKLVLALILFVIMWVISHDRTEKVNIGYHLLFVFLTFSVMISALLNDSLVLLGSTCCGLLIFLILPNLNLDGVKNAYSNLFYSYFMACIVTIYLYNISSFNSQGIIYAFLGVLLLNFLCLKKSSNILWYVIIVFIIVALLSLTRSRTSMLAFVITAFISYCYLFVRKLTVKSVAIHVLVVGVLFVAYEYLIKFFVELFFHKWGNTDLSSNRTIIWNTMFDRVSFLGHGDEYLLRVDAHNTFVQMLDVFGIPAFILMILCIIGIYKKIKYSTQKIVFYNFFTAWTVISIFENLDFFTSRMLPVTMLFFLHVVLLSNEIRIKKLGNNTNNQN